MSIGIVLFTIIFITIFGYCILSFFHFLEKEEALLKICVGYGLGMGLVSFQLYAYARLGMQWNPASLIIPNILFIIFVVLKSREKVHIIHRKIPKIKNFEKIFLAGMFFSSCYVIFEALLRPVTVWDGWAIWLLKAKMFFIDGTILPQTLQYAGADYPLLVSLSGTYMYLMLGQVNDTAVLLISAGYYLALAGILFCVLRKQFGSQYALIFAFLFMTTQNIIRHGGRLEAGQADLPLAYYFFVVVFLFLEYSIAQTKKKLLLLSLFLGITVLTKIEGIFFCIPIMVFLSLLIFRNKKYSHFIIMLFWLIPFVDWYIYKQIHNLAVFTHRDFGFSLEKTYIVIVGIGKELLNIKSWNVLWISYFSLLLYGYKKSSKSFIFITLFTFFQLGTYVCIYLFTLDYTPESSIERLLLHIAPLALWAVAIRWKELYPSSFLDTYHHSFKQK